MNQVILDLGSNVNILPKKTWEQMSKPKLVWSPIQLRLANQYKIYPVGRRENVLVDLKGITTSADFEVNRIRGRSKTIPSFVRDRMDV